MKSTLEISREPSSAETGTDKEIIPDVIEEIVA